MSIFRNIDGALERLSSELQAKLTKDRQGGKFPEPPTFEERRIDWTMDGIQRAIIIQPTFESSGVNQALWNWIVAAWYYVDGDGSQRRSFHQMLLHHVAFSEIEKESEKRLADSVSILQLITKDDLQ